MTETWPPERLYGEFVRQEFAYKAAAETFSKIISEALAAYSVPVHMVSARAKDPLELFKKQRRKHYANPWLECPDIVGARIIVAQSSHKSDALDTLKRSGLLEILEVEDQNVDADPAKLEYRGLHVHVTSPNLINDEGIPIRCEVQIRTIAEHAWSETVHQYVYKSLIDISPQILRTFNRLLVLVELFDQELTKGAEMVSELDSYKNLELSRHLETSLQQFIAAPSDIEITLENVGGLVGAGFGNAASLTDLVDKYVKSHAKEIMGLMESFGPSSPTFDVSNDWILSQGESLLFLALLDTDDFALGNALASTDLYPVVESLALHSGHGGFVSQ